MVIFVVMVDWYGDIINISPDEGLIIMPSKEKGGAALAPKRMRFGEREKIPRRSATGEGNSILGLEIERNGDGDYVY